MYKTDPLILSVRLTQQVMGGQPLIPFLQDALTPQKVHESLRSCASNTIIILL